MNPNVAMILAIAGLALGTLARIAKSDALNDMLARYGIPAFPKRWLPLLTTGIGMAAGVVAGLQAGHAWRDVMVDAFQGILAGSLPVAGHQLVIEGARDGKELGASDVPPAAPMLLAFSLAIVGVTGCAAFNASKPFIRTILTVAEEECAWRSPSTNRDEIRNACRMLDIADPILDALLAAKASAVRSGVLRYSHSTNSTSSGVAPADCAGYRNAYAK